MNVLFCCPFSLELPSAGLTRVKLIQKSLKANGINCSVVGIGLPSQAQDVRYFFENENEFITLKPIRVRHFGRSRIMQRVRSAAQSYSRFLVDLLTTKDISGVIDYCSYFSTSSVIINLAHHCSKFVVGDFVEQMAPSVHRLLNGAAIEQILRDKFVVPKLDGIIGISSAWVEMAQAQNIASVLVPSLANQEMFKDVSFDLQTGEFNIVFVGHWGARELPFTLLDAIKRCVENGLQLKLHVIGNIGQNRFERKAAKYCHEDETLRRVVQLHGFVDDQKRDEMLKKSSLFVILRNETNETRKLFPTRLPEYLLTANPLVVSKCSNFVSFFQHRQDVWFVPPGNHVEELASAITHLYNNPLERRSIGEAGRLTAIREFCPNKIGLRLAEFLSKVQKSNRLRNSTSLS